MLHIESGFILHLTKNATHFYVRCSYTGRNKSSILANLFRTGITSKHSLKFPLMKKLFLLLIAIVWIVFAGNAQVGINTDGSAPDPSAGLDVKFNNKGVLLPRMTLAERNAIYAPAEGLMVYCTNCGRLGAGGALSIFTNGAWTVIGPCAVNPVVGSMHTITPGQIIWEWTGTASGVKWNTANDFDNATDLGYASSKTEIGIQCGQTYTRYVWNYSECGVAGVTALTASAAAVAPDAPLAGTHIPTLFEITWNWNVVTGATGYKWSATNDFSMATEMGTSVSKTETGLTCNTNYTRYIWAYNACGISTATVISASTNPPPDTPVAGTHVPSQTQIVWNWNPATYASGYKWNMVNDYNTATDMGTQISKTEGGLNCGAIFTRYIWAYNACGVSSPVTLTQATENCPIDCGQPFTDIRDGKSYNTVLIGAQCWMAQNLNIGTRINGSQDQTNNQVIEKYCYNDLESNCDIYGGLYQWNEAMQYVATPGVQGICPAGWHLPTDAEWTILTTLLGGESVAGGKMKEAGFAHWQSPNTGATNTSGFTALPGGYRDSGGSFGGLTSYTYFWSSSESSSSYAWYRGLGYDSEIVYRGDYSKTGGFSCRCLKD